MTIAPCGQQHPMPDIPAIIEDRVPGKRGHFTIRFLHDQMSRRKIPIVALSTRECRIETAFGNPAQPQRQ